MPPARTRTRTADPDLRDAWWRALRRANAQALTDLHACDGAEVVFVKSPRAADGALYLDALEADARAQGWVTARVRVLEDRAFDSLDALLRSVVKSLRCNEIDDDARGVVALLEAFHRRDPRHALARFDEAGAKLHATGDLLALARAYLDAHRHPAREAARIEAWLAGTELARAEANSAALSALSARTARRSFGELTRLLRALGHRGTLVTFHGADVIPKLPPGRREDAYTVLRELLDNADGGRGLLSAQLVVEGGEALFEGPRSLRSLAPLAGRVMFPAGDDAPPPHRPALDLTPPTGWSGEVGEGVLTTPPAEGAAAMRTVIRAMQGLPAVDAVNTMSVGHERVDHTITALFEHAAMESSVFGMLVGAYGTGKSHLLLHLAARALAEKRPVFRLSLERLDSDLGNPQRHLRRMLEQSTLPLPMSPTPLDRLVGWTRSPLTLRAVTKVLEALAEGDGEVSDPARRAVRAMEKSRSPGLALEGFLGAQDLTEKPSNPNYRLDAYNRLLLWIALLERVEGCAGPVVIIDEAENLYRGGTTRAERRTALRSLSFYCSGLLPGACVFMAITPEALSQLREEAKGLLDDVAAQKTVLPCEDAAMFRQRVARVAAMDVPALTSANRLTLAFKVRTTHESVRGRVPDPQWFAWIDQLVATDAPPRGLVRQVADRLERAWWARGGVTSRASHPPAADR
jgi:hypothetical protein